MTTVALVGADGSGKTTVARRLEHSTRVQVEYVYMGLNLESSTHMLPTTRLTRWMKRRRRQAADNGPPRPVEQVVRDSADRSAASSLKAAARLLNQAAEEWYRDAVAWWLERRGAVVVFDRHHLADYHAYDMADVDGLPFDRRIHGYLLRRWHPRPDTVVFLDAEPETLLTRKGEGTLQDLARRRADYLELADVTDDFVVVDASQPLETVVEQVEDLILARVGRR